MTYWKLAWFRACLYMLMVSCASFLTYTETWSQETWNNTGPFLKTRLFMGCIIAGAGALLAFMDQTIQRLKNGKGSGDTTILYKQGDPSFEDKP